MSKEHPPTHHWGTDFVVPHPGGSSIVGVPDVKSLVVGGLSLFVLSFFLNMASFTWAESISGSPSMWLMTPMLVGALLRQGYGWWPACLVMSVLGGLVAAFALPDVFKTILFWHVLISVPAAIISALLTDMVFERSHRKLTIFHATVGFLVASLVPSVVSASLASVVLSGDPILTWIAWFMGDFMGFAILLPMMVMYQGKMWVQTVEPFTGLKTAGMLVLAMTVAGIACWSLKAPHFFALLPLIASAIVLGLPQSLLVTAATSVFMVAITSPAWKSWFNMTGLMTEPLQSLPLACMALCAALLAVLLHGMKSEKSRLIASETKFRDAMRFSPIGIGLTTLEGRFTLINDSLCKMIGFSGREMAFRQLIDLAVHEEQDELQGLFDKLVSAKIPLFRKELKLVHKDGHTVQARLAASSMRDAMGRPVGLVVQIEDINQVETARKALATSEERFEFAVDGGDIGVWDLDLKGGGGFYSRRCQEMLGVMPHEATISIEKWTEMVHEKDREETLSAARSHIKGETNSFTKEHRLVQAGGNEVWVLTRGKVIQRDEGGLALRMAGTMTDITHRKQAEMAMEQMHERMLLATEAARIGVWEWLIERNRVIFDERMLDLFGLNRTNKPPPSEWRNFVHPDDIEEAKRKLSQAIKSTAPSFELELRFIRADGKLRYSRNLGTIVRDENGKAKRVVGAFWDITERAVLQTSLREERNRLAVSLNAIADAVITTDERGRVVFINPAAEKMLQIKQEKAQGKEVFELFALRDSEGRMVETHPVRESLRRREIEEAVVPRRDLTLKNNEGEEFEIELTVSPMVNGADFVGVLIAAHDVTNTKEMQRKLSHAATHDALTGLHNRSYFESEVQRHLEAAKADNLNHVLCFLDLDRFKIVNDSAGHSVGDILLKNVSKVISQCVRNSDVLARLGGDEFGILLLNCTVQQAQVVCDKIIETVSGIRFSWDSNIYDIGASIGIVAVAKESKSIADVMAQADVACYAAKHGGRNRCSIYEDGQTEVQRHHKEIFLAAGLRDAIESDRLVLYAQKVIPIQENDPTRRGQCHYELLVRLMDKEGNMIPPGAFIPAAERFGLMLMIDRWVIKAALSRYGKRISRIAGMSISVNLSANSLSDENFLPFLMETIEKSSITPKQMEFEVTETSLMNHMSVAVGILSKMREIGCRVALDDFGAGLSSYTYLKNFAVDNIKIDGSFIKNVNTNPVDWTIVESISQVAHRLGAETTAEFVEDDKILDECRRIGIDYAQGYAIHKPESLDGLLAKLEAEHGIRDL